MTGPPPRDAPIGGALWVAASVVVPNLFVVVLSVATDRELGAGGLGRQSLIAFVSGSAAILAGAGGFNAVVRGVAGALGNHDRATARAAARWGFRLHLLTGAVAGIVVALPALWVTQSQVAWLLAGVVTVLATLQTARMAVLVGAQRWRHASVVGLVTGAVAVPASIALLRAGGGIEGLFAIEAVMVGVNLLWVSVLARRALAGPGPVDHRVAFGGAPQLRFAALSSVGVVVTVVVWRRSEILMLSWLSSDEEVARFSVAFAVSAVLLTLLDRFSAAIMSPFSSLVASGEQARLRIARERSLRLLVALTLPLAGIAAGLGPFTLQLLYGEDYARSGPVLLLMLAALAVLPLWAVGSAVLVAHGDARSPLVAGLVAVGVDVVISILLIRAHGAIGAAVASVTAQVTAIVVLQAMVVRRAGPASWDLATMARSLIVAVTTGVASWSVAVLVGGPLGLVAGGATAVVVLAAMLTVVRPLTMADATWLAPSLHGPLGQRASALLRATARAAPDDHPEPAEPATSA
jgi:O-antigen/teichoic acid export membrane protein